MSMLAALHLIARSRKIGPLHPSLHFVARTEYLSSRSSLCKIIGGKQIFGRYFTCIGNKYFSKILSSYSSTFAKNIQRKHFKHGKRHKELNDSNMLAEVFQFQPLLVVFRATYIIVEVAVLSVCHFLLKDINKRAEKLRQCLIRLGPFYVKLGQALSTRPDLLPNAYCQELAKLQDQIPPFRSSIALKVIESELGRPVRELFAEISTEPVAAASLGQVYKARLVSGELVAVKVQRPGMEARLSVDSHLLHIVGSPLQRFLGARGDIVDAVNEMVQNMFNEIDYMKEGKNAERFAILYGGLAKGHKGFNDSHEEAHNREQRWRAAKSKFEEDLELVKVPKIYWNFSSKGVLTMEWIDGIKLTDLETLHKMNFDIRYLVDQGVFSSLRQLLEEGFFHADPHPGNLLVTKEGVLSYFDFGMMGDFPRIYRIGLIRTLVHFVNRDSVGLANDFASLGFVGKDANLDDIAFALRASFGDESSKMQLDFQGIMSQLSNVMYKYNFRLPPQYALVIRALGSLEGTATLLDPDFKVVASAYPFIIGRLLTDPNPDMRKILRELLIQNNGTIRWHRLERLVIAIAEQSSPSAPLKEPEKGGVWREQDDLGNKATRAWGAFDARTVVSATSDLLNFVLSDEGYRVRVLLVQDIVTSCNAYLEGAIRSCVYPQEMGGHRLLSVEASSKEESNTMGSSPYQTKGSHASRQEMGDLGSRLLTAIHAFKRAVSAAPELWTGMLLGLAARSEARALARSLMLSLLCCCFARGSESVWVLLSRVLHEAYDEQCVNGS